MSLLPAFELGLWNAWILIVLMFIMNYAPAYLINKEAWERMTLSVPYRKTEETATRLSQFVVLPFTIVYSIFLPLRLGTAWFYVGLPICVLGLVMILITGINVTTSPLDEPVTKGMYRVSRKPIYLAIFLTYVGISIVCASWVFLLCAAAGITLCHRADVPAEERFLLQKYGHAYREYMERTPRWIGIPKRSIDA